MVIENKCNLTEQQLEFIEYVNTSRSIPWYYQEATSENYMFYGHTLMDRPLFGRPISGKICSPHYQIAEDIVKQFCINNDIKFERVLRACINATHYFDAPHSEIHIDHPFEHKNFVLYLNQFSKGETYIFDKDNNIIHTIVPEKFKAVVFDGQPHAVASPAPNERRLILIVTFV